MIRFEYTEAELSRGYVDEAFRQLLILQVERTKRLFQAGRPLAREVLPALQFELRMTWEGGMNILRKIEAANYDVLARRPHNTFVDKFGILIRAIRWKET
jgi:phytoene/squalene synthetase